ncbi:MAG: family 10 glycosylhydrolase, partial [Pseudanabaena sp.]
SWVYLGLIDELVVQIYRDNIENFTRELELPEWQEIRQKVPVAIGILTGLRIKNVDMRQIKGQVKVAREMSFDGFSFFFYETLGNRDASFESLLFAPANRPDIKSIASARS